MLMEEIKIGDRIVVFDIVKQDVSLETVKVISKVLDSCNTNEKGKFLFHTEKDARCKLNEHLEDVVLGVMSPEIINGVAKMYAIDGVPSLAQMPEEEKYFKCPLGNCKSYNSHKENNCGLYPNVNKCGAFQIHLNAVIKCENKSCSDYSTLETNHCKCFDEVCDCMERVEAPKEVRDSE